MYTVADVEVVNENLAVAAVAELVTASDIGVRNENLPAAFVAAVAELLIALDVEVVNEWHAVADADADNECVRKMCLAADTTEDGHE
jgi:hypothetical protein